MKRSTVVFLILLRLAIGWHFLFEGIQKVQSSYVGETAYNKPFSSAGYFREAPGPLGQAFRWTVGDPDGETLARLVVLEIPDDEDPQTYKPHNRTPTGLKKDWQELLGRYSDHYDLDDRQRDSAEAIVQQAENGLVLALTYSPPRNIRALLLAGSNVNAAEAELLKAYEANTTEQTRTFPGGEVKKRMTLDERIEEYRVKVEEMRDLTASKLPALGKDVEKTRLRAAKAEVASLRAGLLKELDTRTTALIKELDDKVLTKTQKSEAGKLPAAPPPPLVTWIDWLTRWGLTVMGACLLIGLFTRINCILAAGFLLMTYLAMPAFPWLPAAPQSEGNYLFVNKNVIEMLALLALATTHSGRWFGADGILAWLWNGVTGAKVKLD